MFQALSSFQTRAGESRSNEGTYQKPAKPIQGSNENPQSTWFQASCGSRRQHKPVAKTKTREGGTKNPTRSGGRVPRQEPRKRRGLASLTLSRLRPSRARAASKGQGRLGFTDASSQQVAPAPVLLGTELKNETGVAHGVICEQSHSHAS
jgi:hypothetical protein